RKSMISKVEELRSKRNEIAKLGQASEEGKEIKEALKDIEPKLVETEEKYKKVLREIPNLPADDVKEGKDERENDIVKKWGEPKSFSFAPKDHVELGEKLGIIDIERAAKVSGARFAYLKGDGALLELALYQYAVDTL